MKKRKFLAGAIVVALFSGVFWFGCGRKAKDSKGAGRAITVTKGRIEDSVEATGSVAPLNRIEIKPPIAGRIEKLLVDEGDSVKLGQILAWMSSSDRAAILDAARAQGPDEFKRWEDAYKPTPVVAPISGVVILRNGVVGQTVEPGTVLYAMSDNLIVLAVVDESDIGRIHEGMASRITLDAYPDQALEGKVFDILHEGKNVSNVIQYGVKIRPSHIPIYFRSQMTANVCFLVSVKEDALILPAAAVKDNPDGAKFVMVPGPGGKPVRQEVKTGIENGEKVEIVSGLNEGDRVVLTQGRYNRQQAPQSSPLTVGGGQRPGSNNSGQGTRGRRGGGGL